MKCKWKALQIIAVHIDFQARLQKQSNVLKFD